jgi:hypothetical protein
MLIEALNLTEMRLNDMSPICVKDVRFENEGLLSLKGENYRITDRNESTRINYFSLLRRLLRAYVFIFGWYK